MPFPGGTRLVIKAHATRVTALLKFRVGKFLNTFLKSA